MSTKELKVSSEVSFPLDVVTQTLAAVGRKGSGKTYLATMLAEQMLDAEAQVIVLDPVGTWWGLRVAADGHSKGKDIFVIGGDHGDVPLISEAGAKIARMLVEKRVSAVLDISGFRQGERKRFAADFGEEFFHLKKSQRTAVHLFVEEAQVFAPQNCMPDERRMLGAYEMVVRLGRNYGVGCTLITQRPQSVNKEVLSQTECLCVLQVNGTHERKALDEWVQQAGADRKLVGELPGLSRGEGYVWSPSWLRIFKRVHFAKKTTFDSSKTPEVGKAAKAAMLSVVDVDKLRADMQEVIEQVERDDPKVLRRRVVELERELAKKPSTAPVAVETAPDPAAVREVVRAEVEQIVRNVIRPQAEKYIGGLLDKVAASMESLSELAKRNREVLSDGEQWNLLALSRECEKNIATVKMVPKQTQRAMASPVVKPVAKIYSKSNHGVKPAPEGISRAQIKILSRLVELLNATDSATVPKEQLAAWSEYSPTGGGYNNYLGSLRSAGLIEYPQPGMVTITEAGAELAEPEETPSTDEEMLERASRVLGGSEGRLLRAVASVYPKSITKEQLAEMTEFSANGGGFCNYLGHMRTLGFIDYPQRGQVIAADWLFVEGAR